MCFLLFHYQIPNADVISLLEFKAIAKLFGYKRSKKRKREPSPAVDKHHCSFGHTFSQPSSNRDAAAQQQVAQYYTAAIPPNPAVMVAPQLPPAYYQPPCAPTMTATPQLPPAYYHYPPGAYHFG